MLTIAISETGQNIEVANQDLGGFMSWGEANTNCQKLGGGWRLPSKEELEAMRNQLHSKGQGNFESAIYWSGT